MLALCFVGRALSRDIKRVMRALLGRELAVLPLCTRCRNFLKLRLWCVDCGLCCLGGGLLRCV
jgi:hypothetical protein